LPLGGRQQRAVLALLLAEAGNVVSLARIADELWGEQLPAGHAVTVQTYVFHLREVLEPDRERGTPARILVTEPGGYRLRAERGTLDATTFKRQTHVGNEHLARGELAEAAATLTETLGLWRGEVLADLADFKFVAPLAAELEQVRRAALKARTEAGLALGHHTPVLGGLRILNKQNQLDEDLYSTRMLALYRAGRQSDALDAYRAVRTMLRNQLGVEPGPRLQQLHHQVLTHDPSLDWSRPVPVDGHDRAAPAIAAEAVTPRPARSQRRRWFVLGGSAVAVLAAAGSITTVIATHTPKHSLAALPANSVGAIYVDGSLHDSVPIGQGPEGIAYGAGYLWAVNASDNTVSQINPRSHEVVQQYTVGAAPVAVTITPDNAWVVNSADGTVTRINIPARQPVGDPIKVGTQPAAIASGSSGIWVANSADGMIQQINQDTGHVGRPIPVGSDPDGLAVDRGTVWVANGTNGGVSRIDPATGADVG